MPVKASQVCGYCFTLNNPTLEETEALKKLDYAYMVLGYEIGTENSTPHIQGYIHFKRSRRFTQVKKDLLRSHVEARKGSIQQAIDYCKKDGVFQEFGSIPISSGEATQQVWKQVAIWAREGNFQTIEDKHPRIWIQFSNRLQGLHVRENKILEGELIHEWWVGPTGTGKSKTLWQCYPDHYQKELNKWWCGYTDEEVVAIEEWSPKNECTGSQLKIWADRYPFTAQIKGGSIKRVRPRKIIVLSNYDIDVCFPDSRDRDPLLRRFKVFKFPEDTEQVIQRATFSHQSSVTEPVVEERSIEPTLEQVDFDALEEALELPFNLVDDIESVHCGS